MINQSISLTYNAEANVVVKLITNTLPNGQKQTNAAAITLEQAQTQLADVNKILALFPADK